MAKSSEVPVEVELVTSNIANKQGVLYVPRPSESPRDPLNWSTGRKVRLLVVLCLAAYSGNVAALSGQLAYPIQAKTYEVTILESSYSVSAAISGLAAGALIFVPLAHIFGRWSITFWSLLGSLACAIWSAKMTNKNDYVNFIVSRLMSGLFGAVPSAVGGGMILDVFFLHNRGRAFICYEVAILFGAISGPTFGGFILGTSSWMISFWWTVPLLAITAILVLLFAEETSFDRERVTPLRVIPDGFVQSRIAMFLPGTATVNRPTTSELARSAAAPFLIGLSPITILCGLFTLVVFGWLLLNDILSPTFLQTPVEEGGYSFSPIENAAFSFVLWVAVFSAQIIGMFINDGLPLWICRRFYNGVWKPELRLYVFAITAITTPIGMGICGAGLKNHYHYMVYAVGYFIVSIGVFLAVPVATNYIVESFTHYGTECTLIMTFYRLAWGVAIPFFAEKWIEKVGINWMFGIAAFVTIGSWLFIVVLLLSGPQLRRLSLMKSLVSSEEGEKLFLK